MANIDLIGPEEIYQLFTSKNFIKSLKKAGNYTYKTGYEAGFNVVRDLNKRFHISSVVKGELESTAIDPALEEMKFSHGLNEYYQTYYFLCLHFHLGAEEPTYPSSIDLTGFGEEDIRPILGVGQIFGNKNINLILIQNKIEIRKYNFRDFVSELEELECQTNREVAEFFRKSSLYNSEVLPYKYVKKGGLYLPQFSQDTVAQFSYSVNLDDILLKLN